MSFESFPSSQDNNKRERLPEMPSLKDRLKRWAVYASIIGASLTIGKAAQESHQANEDYKDHIENIENNTKADSLLTEIENKFGHNGEFLKKTIIDADKRAFFEKLSGHERNTKFEGFELINIDEETVQAIFAEGTFYPKNWINGEIDRVEYVDEYNSAGDKGIMEEDLVEGVNVIGEHKDHENTIYFYKNSEFNQEERSDIDILLSLKYHMNHESAHANDWETDKDLSLEERAEFLLALIDRIESDDSFESMEAKSGYENYWELHNDGSSYGLYLSAKEYWAEICSAYFLHPDLMEEEHPKDYRLVDEIIQKQDPDFDVKEYNGPYYDTFDRELLPRWQKFFGNL